MRLLLVSHDPGSGAVPVGGLRAAGFAVDTAGSGPHAMGLLDGSPYSVLLMERECGDLDAVRLLELARRRWPRLAVVVISAAGTPQDAVRLAKLGLDDYLPAGLEAAALIERLGEIVELRQRSVVETTPPPCGPLLIGSSGAMQHVTEVIRLIAPKRSTVLITGPTGTGKDLAARWIHALSPRAPHPMVTVNCSAIPEQLIEAELFGHVRGAFTGAVGPRVGRFEQAHRSTLFLDEIGDMPLDMQAKVLRAVQEREFQRVGSSQNIQVDARVIAATNSDLKEKVRRGEFREDLYYRLNVVPMVMPSLAQRPEDVPPLVEHFLDKVAREEAVPRKQAAAATLDRLRRYCWPGNVRQLENAVARAVILSGEREQLYPSDFDLPAAEPVTPGELEGELRLPPGGLDLDALMVRVERTLLEQALERSGGNKKRAADMLRLKRTTLAAKLRVAGVR